jgi:hypothetical protein
MEKSFKYYTEILWTKSLKDDYKVVLTLEHPKSIKYQQF